MPLRELNLSNNGADVLEPLISPDFLKDEFPENLLPTSTKKIPARQVKFGIQKLLSHQGNMPDGITAETGSCASSCAGIGKSSNLDAVYVAAQISAESASRDGMVAGSIIDDLRSIIGKNQGSDPQLTAPGFAYVEHVRGIIDVVKILKTGGDYNLFQTVYADLLKNTAQYFDMETAIKIIKQNAKKHANNAVMTSLDVIELISDCESVKSGTKGRIFELLGILNTYSSENHPWRKPESGYDASDIIGRISALRGKLEVMKRYDEASVKIYSDTA